MNQIGHILVLVIGWLILTAIGLCLLAGFIITSRMQYDRNAAMLKRLFSPRNRV